MTKRVEGGITYTQNFDVENRLTSVVKSGGGGTTSFVYDADGQRMKTVEPSGKTIYYPFPGFEVEVNGPVTLRRLTYNLGGQSIAQRELGLGLAENYDDGNSTGWTAHSGSWSMQDTGAGFAYRQTNTANTATNSSYALAQSGTMVYEWQATFNSGSTAGGLHFMGSTAADTNHGNSYLVWQDATSVRIHESVSNTLSPAKATVSLPASNGQTYQYRVTVNSGGTITVWRNGAQVLSWTDSSPLTSGSYIALRTNTSNVSFDNLRITGSPASYNTLVYLHGDHLGSIGAVTTSGGALLDTTRFLPFGGYRGSDPAFLTESGFTGHKMNNTATNDLGLIYMNARYYVGSIGRFASADSLVPDPANPQQFNRYTYSLNNPLRLIDPSGHFTEEAIWDYLLGTCDRDWACAVDMRSQWQNDTEWWALIREAKAGDILVGAFSGSGSYRYGVFYTFSGLGDSLLTGIIRSDPYGNDYLDGTVHDNFTLTDFFKGLFIPSEGPETDDEHPLFWAGFIRWGQASHPVFYGSSNSHWEQVQDLQRNLSSLCLDSAVFLASYLVPAGKVTQTIGGLVGVGISSDFNSGYLQSELGALPGDIRIRTSHQGINWLMVFHVDAVDGWSVRRAQVWANWHSDRNFFWAE